MNLKMKIPYKKNHIMLLIYNIPPWLVIWLVVLVLLLHITKSLL